jgi:hypothetical protein
MRAVLVGALLLSLGATDAEACHRFSRWYYPYPQRCDTRPLKHDLVYRVTGDPPSVLPPIKEDADSEPDIPIPDMAAVWTGDNKDLQEGLERKKALILLLGSP